MSDTIEESLPKLLERTLGSTVEGMSIQCCIREVQRKLVNDPTYKLAFERLYGTEIAACLSNPDNRVDV